MGPTEKVEPLSVGAVVGFCEVLDAVNRGALDLARIGSIEQTGARAVAVAARWPGSNSPAAATGLPRRAAR